MCGPGFLRWFAADAVAQHQEGQPEDPERVIRAQLTVIDVDVEFLTETGHPHVVSSRDPVSMWSGTDMSGRADRMDSVPGPTGNWLTLLVRGRVTGVRNGEIDGPYCHDPLDVCHHTSVELGSISRIGEGEAHEVQPAHPAQQSSYDQ